MGICPLAGPNFPLSAWVLLQHVLRAVVLASGTRSGVAGADAPFLPTFHLSRLLDVPSVEGPARNLA